MKYVLIYIKRIWGLDVCVDSEHQHYYCEKEFHSNLGKCQCYVHIAQRQVGDGLRIF